jgi:hypothetical protein
VTEILVDSPTNVMTPSGNIGFASSWMKTTAKMNSFKGLAMVGAAGIEPATPTMST